MADDKTKDTKNSSLNEDVLNDSLNVYTQTEGASDKPKHFGTTEPEVAEQSTKPEKKSKKIVFLVLGILVVVVFTIIVIMGENRKGEAPQQDEYTASADDFLETIEPSQYADSPFADDSADASAVAVKTNVFDASPATQIKPADEGSKQITGNVDTKTPVLSAIKDRTQHTMTSDDVAEIQLLINDALTTMSKMRVDEQTAETAYRSEQNIKMTALGSDISLLRGEIKSLLLAVKSSESKISKPKTAKIQPTKIKSMKPATYIAPNLTWVTFVEGRGVAMVDGTTRELGLEVNEQLKGRGTIKNISSKGCITFFEVAKWTPKEYAPTNGSCDVLRK
jgi:flagellar basal body-associated protein FliL